MNASILEAARIEMARRSRQLGGILSMGGCRELINRARTKAAALLRPRDRVRPVFEVPWHCHGLVAGRKVVT